MTWIEDIGAYLQTQGIGTLGTNIFYRKFDASTPDCIALFDQAGQQEETTATNDSTIRYPELGVRVRNQLDSEAESKINSIYSLLSGVANTRIGSTYFVSIEAIADTFFVSHSKNNRFIYSANFSIQIEET